MAGKVGRSGTDHSTTAPRPGGRKNGRLKGRARSQDPSGPRNEESWAGQVGRRPAQHQRVRCRRPTHTSRPRWTDDQHQPQVPRR